MRPDLGDVVVRARGLAIHLLPRRVLEQLAGSFGSGALAGGLQDAGYWPAPSEGGASGSASEVIDDAIEYEVQRRLDVLARWLGSGRRPLFAGVFEDEERRALRGLLRRVAGGGDAGASGGATPGAWALPRSLRRDLAGARDLADFARRLVRGRSPYGAPLEQAIRRHGPELRPAESAIDRTFALRARRSADRLGGRLAAWVAEGIDLENAWDALLQAGGEFLEGGTRLPRDRHAAIAGEPDARTRRRRLAEALAPGGLGAVFDDPEAPLAALEARALAVRTRLERRAARVEPLGAAPILLVVLRLCAERADLRRINAGVAQGLPKAAIAQQLVGAA